jgi:hypothetical protein
MAQHISIMKNDSWHFKKAVESISKRGERGITAFSGSLLYDEIRDPRYKITPGDTVFAHFRTINKNREMLEVHYDQEKKKIIEIFLVK